MNDKSWYVAKEYEKYREPGNIKVPFWLNPDKHYVGVAWYQKEIEIPEAWTGKRIFFELERTHWETSLYMDGQRIEHQDALLVPHRYLINSLTPESICCLYVLTTGCILMWVPTPIASRTIPRQTGMV